MKTLRAGNPLVLTEPAWADFDFYQVEGEEKTFESFAIGHELALEKVMRGSR